VSAKISSFLSGKISKSQSDFDSPFQRGSVFKMLPIREIKPKNARSKRHLDNKAPQNVENPRTTLFLRYTTTSNITNLVSTDLFSLKKPLATKFTKKNTIHPFEDPGSLEFFSDKNDASLMVYQSHSKKRPHCLTFLRFFGGKVLDMLELLVVEDTMRTMGQFKNNKAAVGLKPLLSFSGSAFESPTPNAYTFAKSLFTDLFKGPDIDSVDVEGLQYMMHFSVEEEEREDVKPTMRLRCYLLKTKREKNSTLPRVEVEEMGPRVDFRVGRVKEADPEMWKEAMKKPKNLEVRYSSGSTIDKLANDHVSCSPKRRRTSKQISLATRSAGSIWAGRISLVFRLGR
jgi:ribosome production factor 2